MNHFFPEPLADTPDGLMQRAGYIRHCVEAGKACYHRQLSHTRFPRFHVYVIMRDGGMEVDLHFDPVNRDHKGNHDKAWAYEGGRVNKEMELLVRAIKEGSLKQSVNAPARPHDEEPESDTSTKKRRTLFEVLFK